MFIVQDHPRELCYLTYFPSGVFCNKHSSYNEVSRGPAGSPILQYT